MKKVFFFSMLLCGTLSAQEMVKNGNISAGNNDIIIKDLISGKPNLTK